jgi:hypothetical protein
MMLLARRAALMAMFRRGSIRFLADRQFGHDRGDAR